MVRLDLSPEQASVLEEVLESLLSDLRMEISATDRKPWRDSLKHRAEMLDDVRAMLHAATVAQPTPQG